MKFETLDVLLNKSNLTKFNIRCMNNLHCVTCVRSLQSRRRQRIARNRRQRTNVPKKQLSKRNKISHLKGLMNVLKSENETLKEAKKKYMIMWNKAEQEKTKIKNSRNLLSTANMTKSLTVSMATSTDILELQHSMFSPQVQEESIGQGRFGVCKVKKFRGTQVAVKEFKDPNVTRTEVLNEAKILGSLKHVSLPICFGVITKESPFCIVTQFYGINGKSVTLHSVVSDKSVLCTFFKANVYSFLYQLTDAICYLHSKKVIHNDIKTDNVLVVEESGPVIEYAPVLIDFGKAKYATATKIKTLSEKEKIFYRKYHSHIAPEVIDGTHRPSVKSDVFSLGVVARKLSRVVERNLDDICSCCLANVRERYNSSMVKELIHTFIA